MEYLLDTACLEYIKEAVSYFPIAGITTNPTIIAKENKNFIHLMTNIRKTIGNDLPLHIQVISTKAEEIIEEGKTLVRRFGENTYVKIPVTKEGIKAIKLLKSQNINVTATTIYTSQQALIAARAGADYVAPYVNRIDNLGCDGCNTVGKIVKEFKEHGIKTRVIAASFKNVQQVYNVASLGAHAVTINPELFEKLYTHSFTDASLQQFINDWKTVYGNKKIIDIV